MKQSNQQIKAITLKIEKNQDDLYKIALSSEELLEFEVKEREKFNQSNAKKKLDLLHKVQKLAGDLELMIYLYPEDSNLINYASWDGYAKHISNIESKIKQNSKNLLKNKYCSGSSIIEQQIVLATIDSSTLEELMQKVTLALTA